MAQRGRADSWTELFSNTKHPTPKAAFPAGLRGRGAGLEAGGAGRRGAIGCLQVRWRRCCESRALGLVAAGACAPRTVPRFTEARTGSKAARRGGIGRPSVRGRGFLGSAPCGMGRRRRSRVRSTGRCGEDGADQGIVSAGGREASGL